MHMIDNCDLILEPLSLCGTESNPDPFSTYRGSTGSTPSQDYDPETPICARRLLRSFT